MPRPRHPSDADFSLVEGLDAPLLASLLERRRAAGRAGALFVVAPTGRRAESLGPALEALLPGAEVMHFPAWETLPHERLSPSPETVGRRLDVLRRIAALDGRDAARRDRIGARRPAAARGRARRRGRGPSRGRRARARPRRGRPPGSSSSPTTASTWSRAAASSRCAAASSTSSRRSPTTRTASSSSATRSIRSARSRSPTSARCPARSPRSICRRAASCCSRRPCATARVS